jgi:Fe-S cluster assembly protein SufD
MASMPESILFRPNLKSEAWRFSGFKGLSDEMLSLAEEAYKKLEVVALTDGGKKAQEETLVAENDLCVKRVLLKVGQNARLDFVLANDLPQGVHNFNFLEIRAEAGARVNLTLLNLGAAYTRQEITAIAEGEGAEINLRSLTWACGTTEVDQRSLQLHMAPGARSNLLFKNILDDHARSIFGGMIRVEGSAQQTDAYQKNSNLILSATATAHTLPGLEIGANDVKCSHGATVGKLNPEELFYIQSRGIPEADAKRLLVAGWADEILQGLPENVKNMAQSRLGLGDQGVFTRAVVPESA